MVVSPCSSNRENPSTTGDGCATSTVAHPCVPHLKEDPPVPIRMLSPIVALLLVTSAAQAAGTPEQKCQSAKNKAAWKMPPALQNAEAKLVTNGDRGEIRQRDREVRVEVREHVAEGRSTRPRHPARRAPTRR